MADLTNIELAHIDLIRRMIRGKFPGTLIYKGERRWFCPHMLGVARKDGKYVIHAYQYKGADEKEVGWRFFYLDQIEMLGPETDRLAKWYPEKDLTKTEEKEYSPPKFISEVIEVVKP